MTDSSALPAGLDALPARPHWVGRYVSGRGLVSLLMTACIIGTAVITWRRLHDAATSILPQLWTLAPLLALHGLQLLFSAVAWSRLLASVQPVPLGRLIRLRVIREGVDALLPIAQFGGEVIASSALMRSGVGSGVAVGGIIVDMVAEFLGQLVYLTLGCVLLSLSAHRLVWPIWLSLGGTVLLLGGGLFVARQCGALRLVERGLPRLVGHVSDIPIPAITGLHNSVTRLFANRRAFATAIVLHSVHWTLGAAEVWIVLRAMGLPIGLGQAIVMNAVGLAARSAGVAVPGSLVVQESGFMIGAALAGMPPQPALVFSLIRRLREMTVGGIALALWQWDRSGSLHVGSIGNPLASLMGKAPR